MENMTVVISVGVLLVMVVVIFALVGMWIFSKKDGFSSVRMLLGKSKIDKMIEKINTYLKS